MTSPTPTLLFVDDEVPILDGLRRKLLDKEDQWRVLCSSSGQDALELLAKEPVDVVVSDMRMPGMDGAAFLNEVRHRHPTIARFVLSGYSEREALLRTVGPAHQYFSKPCNPEILLRAAERAVEIRERLQAADLCALVSGAVITPALPEALTQLFEEIQSPQGSAKEIARIISTDVGLTVQLLKYVNSAYFYVPTKVADVQQAVKLLGFELIRSLALVAGVFGTIKTDDGVDIEAVVRLSGRSLMIGALAKRLAVLEGLDPAHRDLCQCAAMLTHVGTLILFANWPERMAAMCRELDQGGRILMAVERRHFGACHPDIGGSLLSLWGFNDTVVEAVLYHHTP